MKHLEPHILILDQEGIGRRIGDARKLRGLTQQGLAMAVPCSKSLVSQVERGHKPATPWFVAAVARALHTSVTELTGQPYRGTTERTDQVHASIPEIRIALNYWDVSPDLEAAPRPVAALRTDIQAVAALLDKIDYVGLGKRLPGLIEELSGAWHDAHDGDTRRELLMHGYIAAKSMAYRLGYTDLVSVAIERAAGAARATDKPELLAFAAEERCQTFFATGAYNAGLKYIGQAHHDYDDLIESSESGLAVVGSMHLRAAIMAAREPKRQADAWDYIDEAGEVARRIGRETNHYGLIFGEANVKIHEVATAIEMDDPDEAIRRNEGFTPPPDLPPERSSHHYIDLARIRLTVGQPKQALNSLVMADRLAPQHTRNHPMARETATGLLRTHNRTPEQLRSLARRMGIAHTA